MERIKNAALIVCLFVVLLVIFSSYLRANELGSLCGALSATPVLVHVFNRIVPLKRGPDASVATTVTPANAAEMQPREQVVVLRLEGSNGRK